MDLSQIKMVVTDMDGTLLNSKHAVSDRFFELFEELKKRNIVFVAASGRQYHSIVDKLEVIKDDITVIAENGALVKKQEKELLVTPLGNHLRKSLLESVDAIYGAHAMLCGKYKAYFDEKSIPFLEELKEYYASYEIHESLSGISDEIVKIAVYHDTSAEEFIYPAMKRFNEQIMVKVSGQHWVDLNHSKANKGYALRQVQEHFGILEEETLAFGDYNNDLEMLQNARYSFAMENAHPQVKTVANYRTESNDNYGVERILEKLLEAK
ncbi:MAG: HAD family phosphatase [Maribacter sp.]|nr:HAD family phosphatase [Maribacter sp.]